MMGKLPSTIEECTAELRRLRPLAEPCLDGGKPGIEAFTTECKEARSETWRILRVWLPTLLDYVERFLRAEKAINIHQRGEGD